MSIISICLIIICYFVDNIWAKRTNPGIAFNIHRYNSSLLVSLERKWQNTSPEQFREDIASDDMAKNIENELLDIQFYSHIADKCISQNYTRSLLDIGISKLCPDRKINEMKRGNRNDIYETNSLDNIYELVEMLDMLKFEFYNGTSRDEDTGHNVVRRGLDDLPSYWAYPSSTSSSSEPDKNMKPPEDLYRLVVSNKTAHTPQMKHNILQFR